MSELISVVVPVYNVENYLDECIVSIINQSYFNIEIILVNDGSSDKSYDICEKYKSLDSRIKVIHKENGGLSSARNKGLELARGEYIVFIDSDDYIKNDYILLLYESISKMNSDISICEFELIIKESIKEKNISLNPRNIYSNIEVLKKTLLGEVECYAWNKMYKTALLKENDIYYPEGKLYEDIPTFIKILLKAKRISFVKEQLYSYRIREGSITFEKNRKLINDFNYAINKANFLIEDIIAKNKIEEELMNFNIMLCIMNLNNLAKYTNYKNKIFYKEYRNIFNKRYLDYTIFSVIKNKYILKRVKRDFILFKLKLFCLKTKIKDNRKM